MSPPWRSWSRRGKHSPTHRFAFRNWKKSSRWWKNCLSDNRRLQFFRKGTDVFDPLQLNVRQHKQLLKCAQSSFYFWFSALLAAAVPAPKPTVSRCPRDACAAEGTKTSCPNQIVRSPPVNCRRCCVPSDPCPARGPRITTAPVSLLKCGSWSTASEGSSRVLHRCNVRMFQELPATYCAK